MKALMVGIVGPCAAGKTTLAAGLRQHGYQVKHIAQEHSYVKDMWERVGQPDVLIYLGVSFPISMQRRRLDWNEADFQDQVRRLEHARQNADLYVDTDSMDAQQVLQRVLQFLKEKS